MRDRNIILIRNSSMQSFYLDIRESTEKHLSVKSVSRKSNRLVIQFSFDLHRSSDAKFGQVVGMYLI